MDIRNIIPVDFQGKQRVHLPERSLNGPEIKRIREKIPSPPCFDFLFKGKGLEGIIQILSRANTYSGNAQRHSYFSGLSKYQWCDVLEKEVRKAKPFSDN